MTHTIEGIFHDQASGGVAEPCSVGSRWNKFAFSKLDTGKLLEVDSDVVNQKYRLSVDGVNRAETDTLFGETWPGLYGAQAHRYLTSRGDLMVVLWLSHNGGSVLRPSAFLSLSPLSLVGSNVLCLIYAENCFAIF